MVASFLVESKAHPRLGCDIVNTHNNLTSVSGSKLIMEQHNKTNLIFIFFFSLAFGNT